MMKSQTPQELDKKLLYNLLVGGVSPRPIALVSTISKNGIPNLAPFSFFNAFGMNPPCIVFSPVRRSRDGSLKDTLVNIKDTKECVVQVVPFKLVEQVNLASTEFLPDINEFEKSGLTPIASHLVKPNRVAESPFQMECKLLQIIPIGESNGSANLVVCEIVKIHYEDSFLKGDFLDPNLMDLVGRNGGEYYTRASGSALFEIPRPAKPECIGYNGLPEFILKSNVLTGNQLARLAMFEKIPEKSEVLSFWKTKNIPIKEVAFEHKLKDDYESIVDGIHALIEKNTKPDWTVLEKELGYFIVINPSFAWFLIGLYLKF